MPFRQFSDPAAYFAARDALTKSFENSGLLKNQFYFDGNINIGGESGEHGSDGSRRGESAAH